MTDSVPNLTLGHIVAPYQPEGELMPSDYGERVRVVIRHWHDRAIEAEKELASLAWPPECRHAWTAGEDETCECGACVIAYENGVYFPVPRNTSEPEEERCKVCGADANLYKGQLLASRERATRLREALEPLRTVADEAAHIIEQLDKAHEWHADQGNRTTVKQIDFAIGATLGLRKPLAAVALSGGGAANKPGDDTQAAPRRSQA